MLVIVNPHATTVSDRLRNLVIYALQGRFEVEAVATEAKSHAIEIGRDAREGGFDVVVAFGGDGTLNEVANGLAGTDIPVAILPGGNTNVVCRTLGIPNDVVDATEHLLEVAEDFRTRKIDLGKVDDRYFVFSAGAGIDAMVVQRVDSNPKLKATAGPYYYTWAALSGYYRKYLRNPVQIEVEADGHSGRGITVLAQNSDPFTYFAKLPIHICRDVAIDDGAISLAVLKRGAQRDLVGLVPRLLSHRLSAGDHGQVEELSRIAEATLRSVSTGPDGEPLPFPVQVDGDYIGERTEATFSAAPAALTVLA